jgi:hypothetical protein
MANEPYLSEVRAIRDEFHFSRRNVPVITVSQDDPILAREGQVIFIG